MFVKTLMSTYRFKYNENNASQLAKTNGKAHIYAVWHEYGVAFLFAHAWTSPYLVLASRSKDGDFAAFISQQMGFIPVRGSSKKKGKEKGGKEAMEEYVQKINAGMNGGITVDGPKGPRHVCKLGIAKIASQTGCAIMPGMGIANRYWTMNSWDQFKIPKPFSTISITYGAPIWVKPEATPEELLGVCDEVGKALTQLIEVS